MSKFGEAMEKAYIRGYEDSADGDPDRNACVRALAAAYPAEDHAADLLAALKVAEERLVRLYSMDGCETVTGIRAAIALCTPSSHVRPMGEPESTYSRAMSGYVRDRIEALEHRCTCSETNGGADFPACREVRDLEANGPRCELCDGSGTVLGRSSVLAGPPSYGPCPRCNGSGTDPRDCGISSEPVRDVVATQIIDEMNALNAGKGKP